MKKFLIGVLVLAGVYLICFIWALFQLNYISSLYFQESQVHYQAGNWEYAIKGDQKMKPDVFFGKHKSGGLQQVVLAWSKAPDFLRPKIYMQASALLDDIIYRKLTIEESLRVFKKYLGYDNAFLGEIMLSAGDKYLEQGNAEKALEYYHLVRDTFKYEENIVREAEERLAKTDFTPGS